MNNKGWGLGEMLVLLIILFLGFLYSFSMINKNFGFKEIEIKDDDKLIENNNNNTSSNNDSNNNPAITSSDYYQTLEDTVVKAGIKYFNNYYADLEVDTNVVVTIKSLKNYGYLNNVKEYNKNSECSGYVIAIKTTSDITYKAYLNCNNYVSGDYLDYLDDK